MNEGYVKVSWENNAKTGEVENIAIDTEGKRDGGSNGSLPYGAPRL